MTVAQIEKTKASWPNLADTLYVPHTEVQYRELVSLLDELVDEVGEDENHSLASLMEVIGVIIQKYEDDHVSELA
jgi:HTH-type transcriptional regulator/antitoxin HigA